MNETSNPKCIKGFMIDAPRLMESINYYRRLIDFCSEWKFNTIVFRLTDDEGCALRFESHPELLSTLYYDLGFGIGRYFPAEEIIS